MVMTKITYETGKFTADIAPTTQEQINAFGALMGTYGRIHTDPEYAKTTPLKGVITQGMLVLAPLHDVMSRIFGTERWLTGAQVESKIVASARPGEGGRISVDIAENSAAGATGSFTISKPDGSPVIVGTFALGQA
jgi:hypothetical protein